MKIAMDIGGVISKDKRWRDLARELECKTDIQVFIITDMSNKEEVYKLLKNNDMGWVPLCNICCANYNKYGEACKAVLLKELEIDFFFDDFIGYLCWDSQLGKSPIRCLVMPDMFQSYWSDDWKTTDAVDFGRRVAPKNLTETNK